MVAMAVSLARAEATPFASALRSALRKVLVAAPAARAAEAAQLMDRVRLIGTAGAGNSGLRCPAATGPGAGGGALAAAESAALPCRTQAVTTVPLLIQEAITARHLLLLDYRDRHHVVSVREVEPGAFAGTPTQWYLMARGRPRGGPR